MQRALTCKAPATRFGIMRTRKLCLKSWHPIRAVGVAALPGVSKVSEKLLVRSGVLKSG